MRIVRGGSGWSTMAMVMVMADGWPAATWACGSPGKATVEVAHLTTVTPGPSGADGPGVTAG